MAILKTKKEWYTWDTPNQRNVKKMLKTEYPACYGKNPDPDRNCPPWEDVEKLLEKCSDKIKFNDIPKGWECKTCMWLDEVGAY